MRKPRRKRRRRRRIRGRNKVPEPLVERDLINLHRNFTDNCSSCHRLDPTPDFQHFLVFLSELEFGLSRQEDAPPTRRPAGQKGAGLWVNRTPPTSGSGSAASPWTLCWTLLPSRRCVQKPFLWTCSKLPHPFAKLTAPPQSLFPLNSRFVLSLALNWQQN